MIANGPLEMDYHQLMNWWAILYETLDFPETQDQSLCLYREMREVETILLDIDDNLYFQ